MNQTRLAVTLLACLGTLGCRHTRDFLWVEEVPKSMLSTSPTYEIAPGDVIAIRVWNHEANSVERARVREDGKISVPFLNDVAVAGMEPPDLARLLELKLKAFINNPTVTVLVQERRPLRVSVLGKAVRPGVYELDHGTGLLHAIAMAGGPTLFADEQAIFVLRSGYWADGRLEPARIRFRYADLTSGTPPASLFRLQAGDIVVLE
jgi:polysaccharide export outer membrane protein